MGSRNKPKPTTSQNLVEEYATFGYCDVDYKSRVDDRKSIIGFVFIMVGELCLRGVLGNQ